jgi:CsoR family transcriptional regulator, copper-sensing transcriptional repressor
LPSRAPDQSLNPKFGTTGARAGDFGTGRHGVTDASTTAPTFGAFPTDRSVAIPHVRSTQRLDTLPGYNDGMRGYSKDKKAVLSRLRRIEGQVRGVEKMVDEDRYCIDVLTQVNAVRAALESVALQLLADHTEHCVTEAIQSGGGRAKVRELNEAVERLVRS